MTVKAPVQPARPMSRQQMRARLEQAFEDIALLVGKSVEEQHRLLGLRAILTDAWEATQPDEAPEFEVGSARRSA